MKFMKLGSKPDAFQADGKSVRYVASELVTDVTINVGEVKFNLHKLLLNAYNVVAARCAAEYLEMTEDIDRGNLIFKIEVFLNSSIFRSWKDSIICSSDHQSLLPWSEDLKIVGRMRRTRQMVTFILGHEHVTLMNLGKLIDGYLAEIAHDPNLTIASFIDLSRSIPDSARPIQDGLYKAIDIYLKEHLSLTKAEKKKICGQMDVKKLTMEASMHAAQNERLPLRVVVQVLFFEQVRAASGVQALNNNARDTSNSTTNTDEEWEKTAANDNKSLKKQMSRMKIKDEDFRKKWKTAEEKHLVASPADPRSGDYGYSKEEMKRFGVDQGSAVYNAIEDAALRNVSIRHNSYQSLDIGSKRCVYWIRKIMIGNLSLSCLSMLLVSVESCGGCFMILVLFQLTPELYLINQWQVNRTVPCWSHFIDSKERCRSPLPRSMKAPHATGYPTLSDPYMFHIPIENSRHSYSNLFLNQAIYPLLLLRFQADEQAWVDTIKSVGTGSTVRINTMDWLGQSQYVKPTVYWSSLSSVISEVVFSKHATVKLLVAFWAHFIDNTDQYLKSLLYSNVLCSSSKYNNCSGKVEIKYYLVPGYNLTGPAISNGTSTGNIYPGFTRVNHGKYAVSDTRAHIGTSNLIWDYFYTTAGVSFGTYNPAIVSQLQAIFDADWNSPYAIPVGDLDEVHRSYSS
ncbi:hypothetical protein NC653_039056 [Populus alba x Populus x berolinensis]|uniref:Uncharacterized protein n=1 Tax=Populus alba x Populus x berolinensis TaxID=444605 RepID=A0AAD6LAB1_9ROSI|nr:hypothetical protein NC653_039056 [Populus alba x Populus x berolinensis]